MFFSLPIQQWVDMNLANPPWARIENMGWDTFFVAALDKIWYWRNKQMWDPEFVYPRKPISEIHRSVAEVLDALAFQQTLNSKRIVVKWQAPPNGVFKVNVDGASNGSLRRAAVGGVVRDDGGNWIRGFACRIGNVDALRAELWGIWRGLKFVWDLGSRHVVLETDSQVALRAISNQHPFDPNYNLIKMIHELLKMGWTCDLTFGWREANSYAHNLARLGLQLERGEQVFDQAPPDVLDVLRKDRDGLGVLRATASSVYAF